MPPRTPVIIIIIIVIIILVTLAITMKLALTCSVLVGGKRAGATCLRAPWSAATHHSQPMSCTRQGRYGRETGKIVGKYF
jgi:hypothetical protein